MNDRCQEKAELEPDSLWRFFVRLGWVSFGGPAGQIAIVREELVERRRLLSPQEFSAGLNLSLLLPGPEAHQLVIYSGWKLRGWRGALGAGALFVLPGFLLVTLLAAFYASYGSLTWVQTIFGTVRPAVLAIIIAALFRMGRHHLHGTRGWFLAAAAFIAMFFFHVPFPWIILAALGLGLVKNLHSPTVAVPTDPWPRISAPWRVIALGTLVWLAPVIGAALVLGPENVLVSLGLFFSKVAVVTFGGAYAVLPYVADQSVQQAGWLSAAAMKDGLALAETLPGPLVKVLSFVGYLAAWARPTPWPSWSMGLAGSAITAWVTFVPSFIFILFAAPFVDRLTRSPRAQAALDTVTAAVIGVIANLAAWFGAGLFTAGESVWLNATIGIVSLWLLAGRKWTIPAVVGLAAAAGVLRAVW